MWPVAVGSWDRRGAAWRDHLLLKTPLVINYNDGIHGLVGGLTFSFQVQVTSLLWMNILAQTYRSEFWFSFDTCPLCQFLPRCEWILTQAYRSEFWFSFDCGKNINRLDTWMRGRGPEKFHNAYCYCTHIDIFTKSIWETFAGSLYTLSEKQLIITHFHHLLTHAISYLLYDQFRLL